MQSCLVGCRGSKLRRCWPSVYCQRMRGAFREKLRFATRHTARDGRQATPRGRAWRTPTGDRRLRKKRWRSPGGVAGRSRPQSPSCCSSSSAAGPCVARRHGSSSRDQDHDCRGSGTTVRISFAAAKPCCRLGHHARPAPCADGLLVTEAHLRQYRRLPTWLEHQHHEQQS